MKTAPIVSVRAIQSDSGSRIVVEVDRQIRLRDLRGSADRNEIVLRVATTGADPNIAAPIIVHNDVPRRPAPPIARPVAFAPARIRVPLLSRRQSRPRPSPLSEDNRQPGHFLVVIDPGHGGYDPGTESSAGVMEKDLALQNRDAAEGRSGSPRHPRRVDAIDRHLHQPRRAYPDCE